MDSIGLIMALIKSMSHGVGKDGKSAYQYAVEGGYTGTEEEFAAKLAAEIPVVDATLTKSGQAADAKATGDAISKLSEEIANLPSSSAGLSEDEKSLLLILFQNVNFTRDISGTYEQFENLLNGGEVIMYTVTNNLTNIITDNDATTVKMGFPYTATIQDESGGVPIGVTITMGGVDVTAEVYSNKVISIASISGDLVITAKSANTAVYTLPEATTFDGTSTSVIDTGFVPFEEADADFSMVIDFSGVKADQKNNISFIATVGSSAAYFTLYVRSKYGWACGIKSGNPYFYDMRTDASVENMRAVVVHSKGTSSFTTYINKSGVLTEYTLMYSSFDELLGKTVKLGYIAGFNGGFVGTINAFEAYDRVLESDEITQWLGV